MLRAAAAAAAVGVRGRAAASLRPAVALSVARLSSSSAAAAAADKPFKRVGVIGAGLMGHGIAQVLAQAGYAVSLLDVNADSLKKGVSMMEESVRRVAAKQVKEGKLDDAGAKARVADVMGRVDVRTSDMKQFIASQPDFVVEAIVENLDVKRKLFKQLGAETPAHVVLASNTSSFPIKEMAVASGRPAKVVGFHAFNPPQVMQLVEVVSTDATDADTLERTMALAKSAGKTPIKCKDTPGFVVNRILVPMIAEAIKLYDRGVADAESIDTAMKLGAGFPMGPLYLCDYIGLDTCKAILDGWIRDHPSEGFFVPASLERLVKEGKLGRKTGQGFYKWPSKA